MGAWETELASLQERSAGEPHNKATLDRRIKEVQAAIKTQPATVAPVIEDASADLSTVETAVIKRKK